MRILPFRLRWRMRQGSDQPIELRAGRSGWYMFLMPNYDSLGPFQYIRALQKTGLYHMVISFIFYFLFLFYFVRVILFALDHSTSAGVGGWGVFALVFTTHINLFDPYFMVKFPPPVKFHLWADGTCGWCVYTFGQITCVVASWSYTVTWPMVVFFYITYIYFWPILHG